MYIMIQDSILSRGLHLLLRPFLYGETQCLCVEKCVAFPESQIEFIVFFIYNNLEYILRRDR